MSPEQAAPTRTVFLILFFLPFPPFFVSFCFLTRSSDTASERHSVGTPPVWILMFAEQEPVVHQIPNLGQKLLGKFGQKCGEIGAKSGQNRQTAN